MIKKLKYNYYNVSSLMNNLKFKTLFFLLLIASIFAVVTINKSDGFFDALVNIYMNGWYISLLILIFFFNTFNICEEFDKNDAYIIRCSTKKNYYLTLANTILLANSILFLISFMLIIIFLCLKFLGNFTMTDYRYYGISNLLYFIFQVIKVFIFCEIISLLCLIIYKMTNKMITSIISIILATIIHGYPYTVIGVIISSITEIKLFFGYYFYPLKYSSFALEISLTILFFSLLIIIDIILLNILFKSKKEIMA